MSTKRCPGCRACIEGKIPDFSSEAEEEAFWDVHRVSQFPMHPARVGVRGRPTAAVKREKITMMLNPNLKARLQKLAKERGVGYQSLIQEFLLDRVEQELAGERAEAG